MHLWANLLVYPEPCPRLYGRSGGRKTKEALEEQLRGESTESS